MRLITLERPAAAWWMALAVVIAGGGGVREVRAQEAAQKAAAETARAEKEGCSANLKKIFTAIEAYQAEHHDLPNWLSDLVPQYLQDANTLICPLCRRTGKTEGPPLADPNISSSYLFEFCPLPLGSTAPNAPTRTRREWKRRQMGLVGSKVPIVRCRHHNPVLNLAFDGTVYESPGMWELNFTNRIRAEELTASRLFATENPSRAEQPPRASTGKFPTRDPKAGKGLLDLSTAYNASLTESWHGGTDNQLAGLSAGIQNLGGVDFDIRGIVQLAARSNGTNFPVEVKGIPVRQKCSRIHFLHAAAWGHPEDEGKKIGFYAIHFATNQMRLEIPIVYGQSVRDWHEWSGEKPAGPELAVAWKGENGVSTRARAKIRLFRTTWNNLVPDIEIESIDFVSSRTNAAPFLVAITTE
ncbi:MAG TPA: hypothetical protein VJA21_09735 [Verrucomicrobiae bacterium]